LLTTFGIPGFMSCDNCAQVISDIGGNLAWMLSEGAPAHLLRYLPNKLAMHIEDKLIRAQ